MLLSSDFAPALQWVKTIGGSGANAVVAAAADSSGNFYIVGNTSSVDFPATVGAANRGTPLVRISAASGTADRLYPTGLSSPSSIAADPENPKILYVANENAVFRSTDAGLTWVSWSTVDPGVNIRFITADPSDSQVLYAATSTQGVLRSADSGVTWVAINKGIAPFPDGTISATRVWVDPHSSQVLFASTNDGLLRSADRGASWTAISTAALSDNTLTFDPFRPGAIYLGAGSSVLQSTDDGQTFLALSALPDQSVVAAIVADPHHRGTLYAGTYSGVFQSVDSGLTWSRKLAGQVALLAADPGSATLYAEIAFAGMVKTNDGFNTVSPAGPPVAALRQILIVGSYVFEIAPPANDVFAVKVGPDGTIVYATDFGGSADDSATSMALGADGSVYITGATTSVDFPATSGAYTAAKSSPPGTPATFVSKLNPDGKPGWATYFADLQTTASAIAVDSADNCYIAGATTGNLPTTAGAYETNYAPVVTCGFFCPPPATAAFVTKFNSKGTGLIYSTYVPTDKVQNHVSGARALALDAGGNVYFGGSGNVVEVNATGSALLASAVQAGISISALALSSHSTLYATGDATPDYLNPDTPGSVFPATPGAFQTAPQPPVPLLPGQMTPGGFSDVFVIQWDRSLTQILAATLLGGELGDSAKSIAIDGSGNIIVGGETDSQAFPIHAPFQSSFSARAGFVAGFDPSLSHLLYSTYLGDGRPFEAQAVAPDGRGGILLAGPTLGPGGPFVGGEPGQSYTTANLVVVNDIALPPAPVVRLDSVVNFASRIAGPIAPGEPIMARGSGFGTGALLLIDGQPVPHATADGDSIVALMPDSAKTSGSYQIQVSASGGLSNPMYVPAAPASPGVYSLNGSGYDQGYILNSDRTLNSPQNPAAPGSAITIFAAGVGPYTLDHGYAVTSLPVSVFIDGFYANGIAAIEAPVAGLPGNVYQIGVYVPDPAKLAGQNPNLQDFKFPPRVGVKLVVGDVNLLNPDSSAMISQGGIVLNLKTP